MSITKIQYFFANIDPNLSGEIKIPLNKTFCYLSDWYTQQ